MYLIPPNETQIEYIKNEEFYQPLYKIEEDVTQLMEWLTKQPHLPNITDRKWLAHFITGCKYNLQRSKQVIDSYFSARAEFPEFFYSFNREQLKEASKHGSVSLFPKLTPEGNRIICTSTHRVDESSEDEKFDIILYCQISMAILNLQLKLEPTYGNIILYDLKEIRLAQFLAFTPTLTKNLLRCCIDSFPLRVKTIHYINPPKFMSRFITFFKLFLSNKIRDRIFVHDSLEDLYQYIPKDILPDIYGGTGGNLEKFEEETLELLMANKEWLDALPKADLSRRPEHTKTDILDMNGTFKQLQID